MHFHFLALVTVLHLPPAQKKTLEFYNCTADGKVVGFSDPAKIPGGLTFWEGEPTYTVVLDCGQVIETPESNLVSRKK